MVLWKQLRFGHKSALKAYVSSEQLQNVLKCLCVCDVFYFSGAWNIYLAGFCSNPPFPLGPCPKMVVYNAGPATTIQKFTALLSASRTIQSNPIQAQETELFLARMLFNGIISGSTKLTTDAKAAISKKAFSKTSPLHSHACLVTKLRSPYTKC